jgi:hypothetical protein
MWIVFGYSKEGSDLEKALLWVLVCEKEMCVSSQSSKKKEKSAAWM